MSYKAPKVKVKDTISASHHPTNVGGALSSKKIKKEIKVPKISTSTNLTRTGLNRFKNLMRYLKSK
jgi:hypothetical protein